MTEEELKAIETFKHWIEYENANKDKINKADELIQVQETLLNLIEKQYKKIEKAGDYIQQEIWLCEHDIEACCDDEQAIKQYYIDRKEIFEEIQEKLLEE